MAWVLLLIAGVFEVVWATMIKHADSITDWLITLFFIGVSFLLLIRSYKTIPVAAAYTVFVGIGTGATYFVGILMGEPFSIIQLLFLAILLAGIVGMKVFTDSHKERSEQ
ncbi:DMT family transporter [Heyndrickxia sp. NPDC080065]|uniref:DMT family transporter n=1 Tax=Heyndrickxia sp. NPDC080065 TaxID=3390568 RepID=UPI003D07F056